jgi:DNA-binding transcriptional MerR regulator
MEYSIQKLSRMAGVSGRTLRYYDEIGLLKPLRTSGAGYRIYGPEEVRRLQKILFYRDFGMELKTIRELLEKPEQEQSAVLAARLQALKEERSRLDRLIGNLENTIRERKGEKNMRDSERFEGFKKQMMEDHEKQYGEEIRSRYGKETVEASNRKMMGLTEEEFEKMTSMAEEINRRLEEAVKAGLRPEGEEGKAIAALHREWLSFTWPSYSWEAHKGLGEMYVADERFRRYYDGNVEGCAEFLRDAIQNL